MDLKFVLSVLDEKGDHLLTPQNLDNYGLEFNVVFHNLEFNLDFASPMQFRNGHFHIPFDDCPGYVIFPFESCLCLKEK